MSNDTLIQKLAGLIDKDWTLVLGDVITERISVKDVKRAAVGKLPVKPEKVDNKSPKCTAVHTSVGDIVFVDSDVLSVYTDIQGVHITVKNGFDVHFMY